MFLNDRANISHYLFLAWYSILQDRFCEIGSLLNQKSLVAILVIRVNSSLQQVLGKLILDLEIFLDTLFTSFVLVVVSLVKLKNLFVYNIIYVFFHFFLKRFFHSFLHRKDFLRLGFDAKVQLINRFPCFSKSAVLTESDLAWSVNRHSVFI